jgi:Tat protein secretion system quality control protein TatD with DNase activity
VVEKLALITGKSVEDVAGITTRNAETIFDF